MGVKGYHVPDTLSIPWNAPDAHYSSPVQISDKGWRGPVGDGGSGKVRPFILEFRGAIYAYLNKELVLFLALKLRSIGINGPRVESQSLAMLRVQLHKPIPRPCTPQADHIVVYSSIQ